MPLLGPPRTHTLDSSGPLPSIWSVGGLAPTGIDLAALGRLPTSLGRPRLRMHLRRTATPPPMVVASSSRTRPNGTSGSSGGTASPALRLPPGDAISEAVGWCLKAATPAAAGRPTEASRGWCFRQWCSCACTTPAGQTDNRSLIRALCEHGPAVAWRLAAAAVGPVCTCGGYGTLRAAGSVTPARAWREREWLAGGGGWEGRKEEGRSKGGREVWRARWKEMGGKARDGR